MSPIATNSALAFLMVVLSGCASFVESDVTVFHHLDEKPLPKTYAFVPLNVQGTGPEYEGYAALIRRALSKYKFKEVMGEESPDVVVAFGYGIDSGAGKSISIPNFGKTGNPSSTSHGALRPRGYSGQYGGITNFKPFRGIAGSSTISVTEYTRSLWLYIYDANSIGTERLEVIFAANVTSAGSSSELSQVVPAMIQALFKSFPGESTETRREVISTDRGKS